MYCSKPDGEGDYWIPALMLDVEYQGRGYATEAMKQLIRFMREKLHCRRIMIGHRPDNVVAAKLYERLGFMRVSDELIDGEVVLALN